MPRKPALSRASGKPRKRGGVTTSDVEYTDEERTFILAIERYQREANRRFPTASELLMVAVCLGYRRVAEPVPIPGRRSKTPKEEDKP